MGTVVAAGTNEFSLDSTEVPLSSTGALATPDVTISTSITPEPTILQTFSIDTPIQPTITIVETNLPAVTSTVTETPQVSASPTETQDPIQILKTDSAVNESTFSLKQSQEPVSNEITEIEARSDPPLNTSSNNPYYSNINKNWVINESGHDWTMDLDPSHNSGSGVIFNPSTKTFSNFGSTFAILINASDVYFDGMNAILDGGGKTQYGIIVNNQSTGSYNTLSSDSANALSGICIKNITLINFLTTGILFNNVIDTLSGSGPVSSSISNVNASYNGIPHSDNGRGIVIQNSNGIEVSSNTANNNEEYGIFLNYSNNNNVIGNTANSNQMQGFSFYQVSNSSLNNNTASNNQEMGYIFWHSNNNKLNNNNASGNKLFGGLVLAISSNNTLTNNIATSNHGLGLFQEWCSNNTLISNVANDNLWSGFGSQSSLNSTFINNTATGNQQGGFTFYDSFNNTLTDNTATSNHQNGFLLSLNSNNTLTNNTATSNHQNGYYLNDNSINNDLSKNIATANWWNGFNLESSSYNNLNNNTASNNLNNNTAYREGGFSFDSGSNFNTLNNNIATDNLVGFYLSGNNSNINYNTAIDNKGGGFELWKSSNNNLTGNAATGNRGDGFFLLDSSLNNNLTKNTATGNINGFHLDSNSNNNHLNSNTATDNQLNGFYFNNSNNNTIIGNDGTGQDIGFYVNYSNSNTFAENKGCYAWINSSFIPVDINYCTSTPLSTSTTSISTPPWDKIIPTVSTSATKNKSKLPYDMLFISSTIPAEVKPGQKFTGIITVKNTGNTAWTSEGLKFGLKSFGDALKFGIGDMMIPPGTTVDPGQEFSFPVTLTAPLVDGTYDLQFRMFFFIPSKNGNSEETFFGDIIHARVNLSQNAKTIDSMKKIPGSVLHTVTFSVTQTEFAPAISLIHRTPTPVLKPTRNLYQPTSILRYLQ